MISVVIPVYKNKKEFFNKLEINLHFLDQEEIIIVNDNPQESLKNDLKKYRNIILLENEKNLGFGESVNRGVKRAKKKLAMFINSDVVLKDKTFLAAINYFKKNNSLFAVSFAQKEKDGSIVGKNRIFWHRGMFYHQKTPDLEFGKNAWCEGGACLIDKNKFFHLGGFDSIYSPFYWEDIDLSYRAWKSGYQIIFDPKILVEHHHESTISKHFSKSFIETITIRNQFIFIWKNIDDLTLKINHYFWLPYNFLYLLIKNKKTFLNGFLKALTLIKKITKNKNQKTDREILKFFKRKE